MHCPHCPVRKIPPTNLQRFLRGEANQPICPVLVEEKDWIDA